MEKEGNKRSKKQGNLPQGQKTRNSPQNKERKDREIASIRSTAMSIAISTLISTDLGVILVAISLALCDRKSPLTLQSLLFSISLLFSFPIFLAFLCVFLPFPRILGVPRREKPLLFLGPAFGRTDFSRIFIFWPPDFFADFLAGFFLLIFVGKSAQKNPPGKSPEKSSKFYTTKILQHISADWPEQLFSGFPKSKGWRVRVCSDSDSRLGHLRDGSNPESPEIEKTNSRSNACKKNHSPTHEMLAQTVFLGKPCFCPLPNFKRGRFDENGENDDFAFYPLKTRASLLRPPKTTKMTKMADVTQAKAWFQKSRVGSSLTRTTCSFSVCVK